MRPAKQYGPTTTSGDPNETCARSASLLRLATLDADDSSTSVNEPPPSGCLWLDLVGPLRRMLGPGPSHGELLLSAVGVWLLLGGAADVLGIVAGGVVGGLWPVPGFGLCAEVSGFFGLGASALGIAIGVVALALPPAKRWRTALRASSDRRRMLIQCAGLVVLLWLGTSMLCGFMLMRAILHALSGG